MLQLSCVSKVFPTNNGPVLALEEVSLTVAPGEFLCLVGPSGCGKTTLLNIVAGFERPTSGEVRLGGQPVNGPGSDRVLIFQEYALFPWLTVEENIEFGLHSLRLPAGARRELSSRYIESVGLKEFRKSYPHQLSGGMRQRVALARALVMNPRVLLMDEPFTALDAQTRNRVQAELIDLWQKEEKTVLFVTHSVDEAVYLADRIGVLSARPGHILKVIPVELPRPRRRTGNDFNCIREEILEILAAEVGYQLS